MRTEVSELAEGATHGGERCAACPARAASDPLTGLADRRLFQDRLAAALAEPPGAPPAGPAVLLIDLDRFKAVNDTLGHPAGDALLRAAGGRLRSALRAGGIAAMFGGDEFAVLLPEVGGEQADLLCRRLQRVLGERPVAQVGALGFSAGVAELRADDDPVTFFERADEALYRAKGSGKGRAVAG